MLSRYPLQVCETAAEINDCKYPFLNEISELGHNKIRLLIEEGLPAGEETSVEVGDAIISGCTPITVTDESRAFELSWDSYVAYSVRNESFVTVDAEEFYEGARFRRYSKSHFIEYVLKATFACTEYPGPTQHYEVVCEHHIVDVVSVAAPRIKRFR